ncbi:MAG: arsenate reductase (glutaredoxin) [Deltaproteobacteria bacterium]|nr:arsenate reductase (glutaredoxin) [Deltaproteobacteria bacterium]
MLNEEGVAFTYREYTKEPLSEAELRDVLALLGVPARDLLRRRDKAFGELGLTGEEDDDILVPHMANHPTLLQRPIGLVEGRAVVGRPHTNLLELID